MTKKGHLKFWWTKLRFPWASWRGNRFS